MNDGNRYVCGPCPQCGEPEGACMGRSAWGHDYLCCSDKCGLAFADSAARWTLEVETAQAGMETARATLIRARARMDAAERKRGAK